MLEEIKPIAVGAFVNKVQEIEKGVFKLKLHTKDGSKDLVVTDFALFFTMHSFPAKLNPNTFFIKLKDFLLNKKIISLSQYEFDRIVVMEFSDYFLVLEFFNNGNAILTDKNFTILQVLRKEFEKDRALARGQKYVFPSSAHQNPLNVSFDFLISVLQKSSSTAFLQIVSSLSVSPLVLEGIFFELEIGKKSSSNGLTFGQVQKITEKIKEFYTVKKSMLSPVVFKEELLPFPLNFLAEQKPAVSLQKALDSYYLAVFQKPVQGSLKEKEIGLKRLKYSLEEQKKALELLEKQVQEERKTAELIYGAFDVLKDILLAVNAAFAKQIKKEEVMYKVNSFLSVKNPSVKIKILDLDFSKKEIILDIKNE
ncbi:MAG: NFACT family protein [Candidatus Diapherotrites archaeon]|nr:NFACT family protein [Candidatus Diapherotrites archaeon]